METMKSWATPDKVASAWMLMSFKTVSLGVLNIMSEANLQKLRQRDTWGAEINVIETEAASVVEHWLQKIEQEATDHLKQKSENKTENKKETKNEIQVIPSLSQYLAAARSGPEFWENFEDKRPPREATDLLKQKPESKKETKNEIQVIPSLSQNLGAASSRSEFWENFEDKRPPREATDLLKQKPESKKETKNEIRVIPSLSQDLGAASSRSKYWENFEDKRPSREATDLLKQKPESKKETKNETRVIPSLSQDLEAASSRSEFWENFEDKRPPREATDLLKQKPESKTESKKETKNETRVIPSLSLDLATARSRPEFGENFEDKRPPKRLTCSLKDCRAFPSLCQDVAAARSKPDLWETFEDRRPHRPCTKFTSPSSQDLAEDRTRIQFMRWSHTRIHRVTSEIKKDAMEERVDKVSRSVSRIIFQADQTQSETDSPIKDSQ
ncbi:UNVERIFIED_CONTAM: hypothetical protein K2H54_017082 [Gekko kuhli]